MGINNALFNGSNYGSPVNSFNSPAYELGTTVKLLRVQVSFAYGAAGASFPPGSSAQGLVVWGIQWGPHGYTPLNLPADAYNTQFLWGQPDTSEIDGSVFWAPDTDSAEYISLGTSNKIWRGQLPVGNQDIDLHLSYGIIASSATIEGSWSIRVVNST